MTPLKKHLMCMALDALYYSKMYRLLEPKWSGVGIIFTLHHVRPQSEETGFSPNRILDITPEFLDATIKQVRESGYEIVSMDDVEDRLVNKKFDRKFAAFTLDDGYLDNYTYALPIFEKNDAEFTVYVCTGFPDGEVLMWWEIIEQIINSNEHISVTINEQLFDFPTVSIKEKYTAFDEIYWTLRKLPHEKQYSEAKKLTEQYNFDWQGLCRSCSMTWEQLRKLNEHQLVTIGAHTINHYALKKLSSSQVYKEADRGRKILTQHLDKEIGHFAYPYGDVGSAGSREFEIMQDLGFNTSVTTRKGVLFPEHSDNLQALPRVSLNGDYQLQKYVRLFLSGTPFAFSNKFQRLVNE